MTWSAAVQQLILLRCSTQLFKRAGVDLKKGHNFAAQRSAIEKVPFLSTVDYFRDSRCLIVSTATYSQRSQ